MAEYIEREAMLANANLLIDKLKDVGKSRNKAKIDGARISVIASLVGIMKETPAADVEPVVHGQWIATEKWGSKAQYKCSICGRRIMGSLDAAKVMGKYPYCNCGVKMQEVR